MSESTRERVRATIGLVGGYWRPLAGVARLLEELGELAELLTFTGSGVELGASTVPISGDSTLLGLELADLWIISTALSDQFSGAVAEPGSQAGNRAGDGAGGASREGEDLSQDLLSDLVAAAGRIARIVNYYSGPKVPRDFDGWISLSDAVASFHRVLSDAAQAHDVDLAETVNTKLDSIPALDSGRFASGVHDPSTAASLECFRELHGAPARSGSASPTLKASSDFLARQRPLWGSPEFSEDDFASNVDQIVADLTSFTKAAPWERLDGYVVCGPPLSSPAQFEDWFARLLAELVSRDPATGSHAGIRRDWPECHFSFNGLGLTASGFCSLCDLSDPHPSTGTLLVLSPAGSIEARRAQ